MKKFLITFLILIILGGTAFFFGWANYPVPPLSYGIISSKTHGIDPKPVQAGEFRWIWYKLIPTNVIISVYTLDKQQIPINFDSSLPSGDTYAQFIGLSNIDFSYEIKGNISFAINPAHLVNITVQNNITDQKGLDSYMRQIAERIKLDILSFLQDSDPEEMENIMAGKPDAKLKQTITIRFPEIEDFSFIINSAKFPDFILYREIRSIYEEYLAEQRRYIASSFGQRAETHIESQLRFSELERYGELLTKYPILLEYMVLERDMGTEGQRE